MDRRLDRPLLAAETLSFAVSVGLFPAFALGALSPFIIEDLDISRGLYGSLGAASFAAAAALSPAAGSLVDRVGARRALMLLFMAATAAWTGVGIAPAFWLIALSVSLAGIATALANPAATSAVVQIAAPAARARLIGIAQTGPPLAGLIAGFLLPVGASTIGWRPTLLLTAAVMILGVLSTSLAIPAPDGRPAQRSPSEGASKTRARESVILGVYAFLMNIAIVPVVVYTPLYAFQELGWSERHAALLAGVIGIASLLGRLAWAAGKPGVRALSVRLTLLPIVSASALGLILAAGPLGASWMLWVGVAAFGGSSTAWTVLTMLAIAATSVGSRMGIGRAAGAVMQLGFAGGAVGPLLFGLIADVSSYTAAWVVAIASLGATVALAKVYARQPSVRMP